MLRKGGEGTMTAYKMLFTGCMLLVCSVAARAQEPDSVVPDASARKKTLAEMESERWNLFYQATSIGDYHGTFAAPYTGPLSLQDNPERDVSLTTTLFFTTRLEQNTFLIFNPEIA